MAGDHHILMADVVGSRSHTGSALQAQLNDAVANVNADFADSILSPFVVTLGDEFQGVVVSLSAALTIVRHLERDRWTRQRPFRLRYSYVFGLIETDINPDIAHGMLGPGLTRARDQLSQKSRNRRRFEFETGDPDGDAVLAELFTAVDGLSRRWSVKDANVIATLLDIDDDTEAARALGKDRSLIWRRRQNLLIREYQAVWSAIQLVAQKTEPR
ncbi:MAG: SatD family protein [Pseudomonadota bacterium]